MEVRVAGREGSNLGPYRLTRLLGAGGAGEVYLAAGPAHSGEMSQVAVKVLRGPATDPTTQAIAQQAHAISALHLPHALPIFAIAEATDARYIAMAYAPGGSLANALGSGGAELLQLPLGAGTVSRLVAQVARALHPLHEQGYVHGDLKLTNLFVRTAPQGGPLAAVSDFGQAPVLGTAVAALSRGAPDPQGSLAGALRCAAPEQLAGRHLPASDQYALATIAYLLLTGRYPFAGDARALAAALAQAPVTPPTQVDPTIPPPAEAALLRALAKNPNARFPDIASFAQALGDGLASTVLRGNATQQFNRLAGVAPGASSPGTPTGALPVRGGYGPGASYAGRAASGVQRVATSAPRSSTQRMLAIVAVVAIVVLGLAGFLGLRALAGGSSTGHTTLPNFGGLDYAPTVTPDATAIAHTRARAAAGLAVLKSASATTPVFSDPLKTNAQHWPIDGKQFFFGPDGKLHGTNVTSHSVATLDQPAGPPVNYLVTVNMTFLTATPSDVAGLNVRVMAGSSATAARYMVLIAPEGRFEVWYFDGAKWSNLDNGYTSAIKPGLNVSNTLAILCDRQEIWLFVNDQFVTNVHDYTPPKIAGTLGPAIVYTTTEVAYDTYNVYQVTP
jgi:hypothetical protein